MRSGAIDIIVIDSVAALVPKQEIEGDMGRQPCRTAGKTDVPGFEKTDTGDQQIELCGYFYQSAP